MAFEGIRSLGMKGVNVTVPYKEAALNFVDDVPEDLDRGIGALNTVVNQKGRLLGFNTDAPGFLTAVKEELEFNPRGKKALVLGAGGAARGVAFALAYAHADKIWIYNRTPEKAKGLQEYLEGYFPETEIESIETFEALKKEKAHFVVNATSCGMKETDPLPMDLRLLSGEAVVYDLIYSPSQTPFLKLAGELGFKCANGMGMLAAQAALSFGLWTGRKEDVREIMSEVLQKWRG